MYIVEDSDNYGLNNDASAKYSKRVKVFGQGTVSVKPDAAEVIIGVITENVQLQVAQEENSKAMAQVINSLSEIGVLHKNMQTQNYNIRTNYDYIDGKQVFRGYEVSNYLKVVINNIDSIGEIIDTAVKNGANTVSGISFIVSDTTKYYYEALRLSVEDAQNKAIVMASDLKVNLNIIPIQVNEQDRGISTPLVMTLKYASETTPIEAGVNKIIANIEAIFVYK